MRDFLFHGWANPNIYTDGDVYELRLKKNKVEVENMENTKKLIDADSVLTQLEERLAYLVKERGHRDHYTRVFGEAISIVENAPVVDVINYKDMYSKRYVIENIAEKGEHNPSYDDFIGGYCFPAYLKVGSRGWLLCVKNDSWTLTPHRLHTSIIKNIFCEEDMITVETEHTSLFIREIKES